MTLAVPELPAHNALPGAQLKRLGGALGAEVVGLDLATAMDALAPEPGTADPVIEAVHDLLTEHSVVAFRDQELSPDQHDELTRRLGGHGDTPFVRSIDGHPGMVRVIKEADEPSSFNFGGAWHSDWSFQAAPPSYTVLYGRDIPPHGGDTLWTSQYLAYETLSEGLRTTLDGLDVVHSAGWSYAADGILARTAKGRSMEIDTTDDALAEQIHPAVITHDRSGRRCLFVNQTYSVRFDGWTRDESLPLLNLLYDHATREHFTCRLRWEPNTLTIWDNRCTQHLALNDYRGHRRELLRTTVAGTKPER